MVYFNYMKIKIGDLIGSIDVANLFLKWANKEGELISNLKMQKLLYFAQAWHLAYFKTPLFIDPIKAWEFGPVVLGAYHHFKPFGYGPIKYKENGKEDKKFKPKQLKFLEDFYDKFIRFSAHELVNIAHNDGPWKVAFEKGRKEVISTESMLDFYSKRVKK